MDDIFLLEIKGVVLKRYKTHYLTTHIEPTLFFVNIGGFFKILETSVC